MPRFIIVDAYSGFIWGDTGDLDGPAPIEACQRLDESLGAFGRTYAEVPRLPGDTGYIVYRADIGGSEAVPLVRDGQDPETIADVERLCDRVATVHYTLPDD